MSETVTASPNGSHRQSFPHANIRDVAALAGVSIGTVSNTINRPESVRKITRKAVEEAIAQLRYVPNEQARSLGEGDSRIVGLIVLDFVSPFFMEIAQSVEHVVNERQMVFVLGNSGNRQTKEHELIEMLTAQRAKGVLVTPAFNGEAIVPHPLADQAIPVVYVDYTMGPECCSVAVDHYAGEKMVMDHLLKQGHTTFAFVGDKNRVHQFQGRVRGVKDALSQAGLSIEKNFTEVPVPSLGLDDGALGGTKLLELGSLPTAILCGNDMMAFGVFRTLHNAGVRIPEDVALVGYDDIDFASDWIVPLTSIRQPTGELGSCSTELLLDHVNNPEHEHKQIVLQPELVVRDSSLGTRLN